MHRIPIGPIGADKIMPIDTQLVIMDIIVPTRGGSSIKTYKFTNKISDTGFQMTVFLL